jgi:hypothetical protein
MDIQKKNYFYPPASALWNSQGSQRTLHIFANHTNHPKDRNLQKIAIPLYKTPFYLYLFINCISSLEKIAITQP